MISILCVLAHLHICKWFAHFSLFQMFIFEHYILLHVQFESSKLMKLFDKISHLTNLFVAWNIRVIYAILINQLVIK